MKSIKSLITETEKELKESISWERDEILQEKLGTIKLCQEIYDEENKLKDLKLENLELENKNLIEKLKADRKIQDAREQEILNLPSYRFWRCPYCGLSCSEHDNYCSKCKHKITPQLQLWIDPTQLREKLSQAVKE